MKPKKTEKPKLKCTPRCFHLTMSHEPQKCRHCLKYEHPKEGGS